MTSLLADTHRAVATVLFGCFVRARFWHADYQYYTKEFQFMSHGLYSTGICSLFHFLLLVLEDLDRIVICNTT
jgi:hypothetical protein